MSMDYEEIEKYVKGELTEELKNDFEKRMKDDSVLEKEVELFKESILDLENSYKNREHLIKLKGTLNEVSGKYFQEKNADKIVPFKKYLWSAVAIAAMLVIGFFIFNPKESLFDQYAKIDPINVQVKGEIDEVLIEGVNFYNAEKYVQAKSSFEKYLKTQPEDLEIELALGQCYMQTGEMEKARSIFNSPFITKSVFKDKAEWYLVLSYLMEKDNEMAKKLLDKIPATSFYSKKAKRLKAKLD